MAIVLPIVGNNDVRPYDCRRRDGFNSKSYRLVVAPTVEPVSLETAKAFLKIDTADEDAVITALISSARRMCEEYTKRSFITQTWELTQDAFSDAETSGECGRVSGFAPYSTEGERSIDLSREPIQSVVGITYVNSQNAVITVASSTYTLDVSGGRILLNDGACWPTGLRANAAVTITYKAGYGDTADKVPADIVTAVLMTVTALYETRGCGDMPDGVKSVLSPYQTVECFGGW